MYQKKREVQDSFCAVAAAFPDGQTKVIRGTMEGIIGYEIKRREWIWIMIRSSIYHNMGKISAELSSDEKNAISHRGEALKTYYEKFCK